MSRRVRLEAQKAIKLREEQRLEEEKEAARIERIYSPIIWKMLPNGLKIQDLKPHQFNEVMALIEEHYVAQEVICRNAGIHTNPVSKQSFLDRILYNLRDNKSIIILDEIDEDLLSESTSEEIIEEVNFSEAASFITSKSNATSKSKDKRQEVRFSLVAKPEPPKKKEVIAGILILKVVKRSDFGNVFSRVQLTSGQEHESMVKFYNSLTRPVDIFDIFHCDSYLRYYLTCIRPDYRKNQYGYHLYSVGYDVARSLNVPVVMGTFGTVTLQWFATQLGMKVYNEIAYISYFDDYLHFCDLKNGNYTCALMAGRVPKVDPKTVMTAEDHELDERRRTIVRSLKSVFMGK